MKKLITTALFVLLMAAPTVAGAQQTPITVNPASGSQGQTNSFCTGATCKYTPLERLPGQQSGPIETPQQFGDYVGSLFRIFIVLGGMFAVSTFVFGGILYMTADVLQKKDFARKQMQRSVYGLLLLLGSFLLLTTINPNFARFNFNPAAITGNTSQTRSTSNTTQAGQLSTGAQATAGLQRCAANQTAAYNPDGTIRCDN